MCSIFIKNWFTASAVSKDLFFHMSLIPENTADSTLLFILSKDKGVSDVSKSVVVCPSKLDILNAISEQNYNAIDTDNFFQFTELLTDGDYVCKKVKSQAEKEVMRCVAKMRYSSSCYNASACYGTITVGSDEFSLQDKYETSWFFNSCRVRLDRAMEVSSPEIIEETLQYLKKCFFQICYSLLVCGEMFGFQHNDLHLQNICYLKNNTGLSLQYCYKNKWFELNGDTDFVIIIDYDLSLFDHDGELFEDKIREISNKDINKVMRAMLRNGLLRFMDHIEINELGCEEYVKMKDFVAIAVKDSGEYHRNLFDMKLLTGDEKYGNNANPNDSSLLTELLSHEWFENLTRDSKPTNAPALVSKYPPDTVIISPILENANLTHTVRNEVYFAKFNQN